MITPSDKENSYKAVKLQLEIYGCHEIGKINIFMHNKVNLVIAQSIFQTNFSVIMRFKDKILKLTTK